MTSTTQPRAQLQAVQLMPERRIAGMVPVAVSEVRVNAAVLAQAVRSLVQRYSNLLPIGT